MNKKKARATNGAWRCETCGRPSTIRVRDEGGKHIAFFCNHAHFSAWFLKQPRRTVRGEMMN